MGNKWLTLILWLLEVVCLAWVRMFAVKVRSAENLRHNWNTLAVLCSWLAQLMQHDGLLLTICFLLW